MILGLHTKKELETEIALVKEDALRYAKVEFQKEINKLKDEHEKRIIDIEERYGKVYGDMLLDQIDLEKKLECKENEIYVLRTILTLETDKEIKRLECIARRTRKARTKKKIENRIIGYKMRKIAYKAK